MHTYVRHLAVCTCHDAGGPAAIRRSLGAPLAATTPALPEPAAQAARAKAGERYDQFVVALGRRLAKGPKLRQEISEDSNDSIGEEGRARSE